MTGNRGRLSRFRPGIGGNRGRERENIFARSSHLDFFAQSSHRLEDPRLSELSSVGKPRETFEWADEAICKVSGRCKWIQDDRWSNSTCLSSAVCSLWKLDQIERKKSRHFGSSGTRKIIGIDTIERTNLMNISN